MQKTVCDLCDDDQGLEPKTGMYVLIVRKITKNDDAGQTYQDTEYDACGACMSQIRRTRPKIK